MWPRYLYFYFYMVNKNEKKIEKIIIKLCLLVQQRIVVKILRDKFQKKKNEEKIYNLQKIKDQAPHYFIQSFKHLKNIELEHLNKQWRGNLTIYMIFWESNGVELGMPILSTDFFIPDFFKR